MCRPCVKNPPVWSPFILYMHPGDHVTHIKLVDIVDFFHCFQAQPIYKERVGDMLFRSVSVSDTLIHYGVVADDIVCDMERRYAN